MTDFVRVRDNRTRHEYTVSVAAAAADHLTVIDKPAVDRNGTPLHHKPFVRIGPPSGDDELRGAALDAALRDAGLPTSGTADEKRQRLADHNPDNDPQEV